MEPSIIFKVLWILTHFFYTLFESTRDICATIKSKLFKHKYDLNNTTSVLAILNKNVNLKKIPSHVTFLLGCEEPSYKDLAKLIIWSIISGVSFFSFYDMQGKLKENEEELKFEIDKQLTDGYHVIWHRSGNKNGYKNGYTGRKIHVKVFSPSDSRANIVDTCKNLQDVSIETIDSYLRTQYEFPDPHLGIYCGKHFNICGYPPWQIRLTEFINLRTHHNITFSLFMDILQRYNKCEQRVGK